MVDEGLIEIERETDKSVWIDGYRYLKQGGHEFYDTWEEAQAKLEKSAQMFVCKAEKELEYMNERLISAKKLKPE